MSDLNQDIRHLGSDLRNIHDLLDHLSTHSRICSDLVRESNIREANELFVHLNEIDNFIHGVEDHIVHIKDHLEKTADIDDVEVNIDIDDLKDDAKHTSFDLKDIHFHIEHLIKHTEMCRDIITPSAEEELKEIRNHLKEIDEYAHELLNHINDIRGGISTKYSEFVWEIPAGFDEFINPSRLIDCNNRIIENTALKLVDGLESIQVAIENILCFVRDFIDLRAIDVHSEATASKTLNNFQGSEVAKSILACALSRAVSISSQVHFAQVAVQDWLTIAKWNELELPQPDKPFSISWPEFYINNKWEPAFELMECRLDDTKFHERFLELGIKYIGQKIDPSKWVSLPVFNFEDNGSYAKPIEFIKSPKFLPPPCELERRLFAGFFYIGKFEDKCNIE